MSRPFFKTVAAVGFILVVALLPVRSWAAFSLAGAVLSVAFIAGRAPLRASARRILFLAPFALGSAGLALFQPEGWSLFCSMMLKSFLCVGCVVLLSETTPFSDLLDSARRVGIPPPFTTALALTYRYLFLLKEETERLRRARASRTFAAGRRDAWTSSASVGATLFIRASERAERVYDAMRARGWTA